MNNFNGRRDDENLVSIAIHFYESRRKQGEQVLRELRKITGLSRRETIRLLHQIQYMSENNLNELQRLSGIVFTHRLRAALRGEVRAEREVAEAINQEIARVMQHSYNPNYQGGGAPVTLPTLWRSRGCHSRLVQENTAILETTHAALKELDANKTVVELSVHTVEIGALSRVQSRISRLLTLCIHLQGLADPVSAHDDDPDQR